MIKAIETVFAGYRFRSRLEARWAVFFAKMGVKFEYEREGYELPSGWYLPDFWIPSEQVFVEIKPGPMPANLDDQREMRLACELRNASGKSVYVFYGEPADALAPEYPGMTGYLSTEDKERDHGLTFMYLRDYEGASLAARQARFEHGENGFHS